MRVSVGRMLSVFAASSVVLCLWLAAPSGNDNPPNAVDLLVDLSTMPAGWVATDPLTPDDSPHVLSDEDALDYAGITFHPKGHDTSDVSANHEVWRFRNGRIAMLEFHARFRGVTAAMTVPPGLRELASWRGHADRFRLFCYRPVGCGDCIAVAQYGEFLSKVRVPVTCIEHAPLVDLRSILEALDRRMQAFE